jgi:hypothetical protein
MLLKSSCRPRRDLTGRRLDMIPWRNQEQRRIVLHSLVSLFSPRFFLETFFDDANFSCRALEPWEKEAMSEGAHRTKVGTLTSSILRRIRHQVRQDEERGRTPHLAAKMNSVQDDRRLKDGTKRENRRSSDPVCGDRKLAAKEFFARRPTPERWDAAGEQTE